MVSYSTNWMGPVSVKWYEDRGIPFEMRETSGTNFAKIEYKHFLEEYAGGRIDVYGLDESEYWGGKCEYGLDVMNADDWRSLSIWLDDFQTEELLSYSDLIGEFERENGEIRWWKGD